jgi:Ca2+-binding RTX toxin-like protein
MIGGIGSDTYVVDNVGDVVNETGGDGTDLVRSGVSFNLSDAVHAIGDIENLTLTGATTAINGTGNGLANVITGNGGANILAGLGGGDTLDGGAGLDTATYAASSDFVNVSLMTGFGSHGDAEGDTLFNFEKLIGSNFDDTLEGNAGANTLTGGAGIDTVSYENAGGGVTVNLTSTRAQVTGGAGSDTLSGFENVTGSQFVDTLTGTTGANAIDGGAGNDRIIGGGGADTLTGGADADTFVFNVVTDSAPAAADFITDFVAGTDKIDLSLLDANSTVSGNQAFLFVDGDNANVIANSVTWHEDSGNTIVQVDLNHDTTAAEVQIVLQGTGLNLHASDFIL